MCGRFSQAYSWEEIVAFSQPLTVPADRPNLQARYNIAPTTEVDIIIKTAAGREARKAAQTLPAFVPASLTCWVAAFYEMTFRTPEATQNWCDRVYEVPGIATPTGICWGVPPHLASYAASIAAQPGTNGTWTTLPWSQWVATYYP